MRAQARVMHKMCTEVAKKMNGNCDVFRKWAKEVGHSVGHHHGFVPLLSQCFCMLEPAEEGARGANVVKLGASGVCYRLKSCTPEVTSNIVRFVWMATVISRSVVPTSVQEWLASRESIYETYRLLNVSYAKTFSAEHYHMEWLIRLHFAVELRATRRKLNIAGATCWQFAKMSLDQNKWVQHLSRRSEGKSVKWLLARCGYKDFPEYFSMWCCILLSPVVFSKGAVWLAEHEQELTRILNEETEVPPHVSSLIRLHEARGV